MAGNRVETSVLFFTTNLTLEHEYLIMAFRHGIVIPLYKATIKTSQILTDTVLYVTRTPSIGKLFEQGYPMSYSQPLRNI